MIQNIAVRTPEKRHTTITTHRRKLKIMPAVLALQERFNFTSHAESPPLFYIHFFILRADEIKADEELKDFFETDTEAKQKNGLMSKIIEHDTINVKKVGKDTVTYKITAPDFSKYFTEMKKSEVTEENIESFTDDYISNAEKVTNEVEIPYTYKDGIYSAEYDTEEFVNALTGNLVTAYQELMQDVQKELSEETGDEKNN